MATAEPEMAGNSITASAPPRMDNVASVASPVIHIVKEQLRSTEKTHLNETTVHALAGIFSRCSTEAIVSPLNLVKTRLQHNPALRQGSLPRTFANIIKAEGFTGCFRGLPPRLLWTAPLASVTFLYYEEAKHYLSNITNKHAGGEGVNVYMLAAGPPILAMGCTIRTPFDIVEMRLQLLGQGKLPGTTTSVFRAIANTQGYRGLFRGLTGAFSTVAMFCVSYFITYEETRRFLLQNWSFAQRHEPVAHLSAGMLGGAVSAVMSNPLDVIKTRMQTMAHVPNAAQIMIAASASASAASGSGSASATAADAAALKELRRYPSMLSTYRAAVEQGGRMVLCRGLVPRVYMLSFAGAITFTAYEGCKRIILSAS